jgi:hypothetical protein
MILLARCDSPEDAYLLRSFLASRGIGSSILDEYVPQLFWHYRYASGGTRVVLDDAEDLEAAEAACAEYFAALRSGAPAEPPVRGWPLVLLISLVIGAPFMIFGRKRIATASERD